MTITDINDHSPVFEQSDPVRLTVVEHSQPPGSFLTDISATDADVGTNAHIRYSITAGDDNSKLVYSLAEDFKGACSCSYSSPES